MIKTMRLSSVYHIGVILVCFNLCASSNITVVTNNGNVRGYVLDLGSNNVVGSSVTSLNVFLGIPYAEAPVGNLRFARPVPKSSWAPNVLDAFTFAPACPQRAWFLRTYSFSSTYDDFSEDCLYLNIYVPQDSTNPDVRYPVLFWIHGGSYTYGSGAEYDGRILAQEGIIVVTINYRLGALGFLSTDNDQAPGNYGLLDQLMALQWVRENIESFHGDPNKITIAGQSAGGGSTSLHMFSPKAKGLFNSAIIQSGCALSPWSIYCPPHTLKTQTNQLAVKLGCPSFDSHVMLTCLRTIGASTIANTRITAPPMIATFAPRVDGYYITDLPETLLERGEFQHGVNVLNGYLPDEVAEDYEGEPGIDQGLTKQHLENLFYSKSSRYLSNADDMYRAMKCAYPPSDTDVFLNRDHLIDMNSDYGYNVPHIKLSRKLTSAGVNVWLYNYIYRSPDTLKKPWIGVPHAEELYYIFGAPFLDQSPCPGSSPVTCRVTWGKYQPWSGDDRQVSKNMMKLWADFVKLDHGSNQFTSSNKVLPQFEPGETVIQISAAATSHHLVESAGQKFWDSFNYLNLSQPIPDVCNTNNGVIVGK